MIKLEVGKKYNITDKCNSWSLNPHKIVFIGKDCIGEFMVAIDSQDNAALVYNRGNLKFEEYQELDILDGIKKDDIVKIQTEVNLIVGFVVDIKKGELFYADYLRPVEPKKLWKGHIKSITKLIPQEQNENV